MKRQPIPLLTVFAILVFAQLSLAALPSYEVIDLGTLGGDWSGAHSINDGRQVVGWANNSSGNWRATLFDPTGNGNNIDLGTLGGTESSASSINCNGQIVGWARSSSGDTCATLFDRSGNGNNTNLSTFGGNWSEALSINNNGQIVGMAENSSGNWRATLFDPSGNGNNTDLGTLGGTWSWASSINNSGQIVGCSVFNLGFWNAALFDPTGNGDNIDLGTIELGTPGYNFSQAFSINDSGQIVGRVNHLLTTRAALFDPTGNGNNINLGTLGGDNSIAWSINDMGQIVGWSKNSSGDICATLFDPTGDGNNIDLNTLIDPNSGWTLASASSINNSGWIVGQGINPSGDRHAFLMMTPVPPAIYYVDADANGANDGSSWADGFNDLQDALFVAWSGDEIRVAQGIYKPDEDSAHPNGTGYRTATFRLKNGVVIKGGYAGFGTPEPNARDIDSYKSILSGDLNGDDVDVAEPGDLLYEPTRAENSYHVATGSGTDETATLDGFTIIAGNADSVVTPPPPPDHVLNNLGFIDNSFGGGMYNNLGSPTVTNCTFSGNTASQLGGGMSNSDSSPTLTNCTFTGNSAADHGGGMFNYRSSPAVTNCTFSGNVAGLGAGMHNWQSNPTVNNCTFSGNSASGGGGMNNDNSSPNVSNCTFTANSANWQGGGMRNYRSSPNVNNCTFTANSANWQGGGMRNYRSSPNVNNCTFTANLANERGGGGMDNRYDSSPTVINCIFSCNISHESGGGMANYSSSPRIVNSTFSGNYANADGGGMYNRNVNPTLTNCIIWGNSAGEARNQIWGGTVVNYSCIQSGWPGEGNIDADPCFIELGYWNANGVWVEGDYHLWEDSLCINAGDPNYIAEPNETDLDGNPRVIGGRIDMGVYEFNHIPVADAGVDKETYAWIDGIAEVTLDGTGSFDEDDQPLTYLWSWTFDSNTLTATEPNLTIELPVGEHIIELIVNDGMDDSEPDQVVITVIEPMEAHLWIFPRLINRYSRISTIFALLRLPEGVTKDQVDSDQPLLLYPGGIEAIGQYVIQHRRRRARQTSILALFDKGELMAAVPDNGSVQLQVVGWLKTGRYFYGSDTVRIIGRRRMPRRSFQGRNSSSVTLGR